MAIYRRIAFLVVLLTLGSCEDIVLQTDDTITEFKDFEPERLVRETTELITEETPTDEVKDERFDVDNESTVQETTVTEAFTMSLDNHVYTVREPPEDIYSNQAYNVQLEPTATTSRTLDAIDSTDKLSEEDEDMELSGQRNPKTDNSEVNPTSEMRSFDKPKPTPALSKSARLRSWLEDSWLRPPTGVLVPLRPAALSRALAVWNDLTADGLNLTDIVIVGYDANGVNWRSRHNLQPSSFGDKAVSNALTKLLRKYQGVYTDSTNDGTMRALASAAKLVPYDSALFLVTDKAPGDPQRMPLALRALVEKRLKVYTIWTDSNYPSAESEMALQDLRNVSSHTEGEVLPYALPISEDDGTFLAELQQWNPFDEQSRRPRVKKFPVNDNYDTLLMRKGGGEAISLGIPVENGVTALKIYLEGSIDHAILYPPNDGLQVDLYNTTSVKAFSPTSAADGSSPREVSLVFPRYKTGPNMLSVIPVAPSEDESMVGLWHLSVRCDLCNYRLRVAAKSALHLNVDVIDDMLKLKVTGPVASVRDTLLVDEYGAELAKIPFSYQPMTDPEEVESTGNIQTEVEMPNVASSNVYVRIFGRDTKGEPFTRISGPIHKQTESRMGRSASFAFPDTLNDLEIAEEIDSIIFRDQQLNETPYARAVSQVLNQSGVVLTSVQVGLSTRLYGYPGDQLQLYFEVTNYRPETVSYTFRAKGELNLLRSIDPTRLDITTGQTATVIVNLLIPTAATPGGRDMITFTASGTLPGNRPTEPVSISTYVNILNPSQSINDVGAPEISHNFQGSCLMKQGSDCADHTWSTTVLARDPVAGLLRLTSSPVGLIYDTNFISGSKDQMRASYKATCCMPRVIINAVDALGNTNSYTIDISNYVPPEAIAAIVLGVILLIAILALVIFLIYWCVKRRKVIRDLPTYTSRNVN